MTNVSSPMTGMTGTADMARKRAVRRTVGKGAAAAAGAALYVAPALTRLAAPSAFAATAAPAPPPATTSACGSFSGHANFQLSAPNGSSKKQILALSGEGPSTTSVQTAVPQFTEINLDCCAPGQGVNFNLFYTDNQGEAHHFHATAQLFDGHTGTPSPTAPTLCSGAALTGTGGGPEACFRTITGWVQGTVDGGPGPGTYFVYYALTDNSDASSTQDDVFTLRVYDAQGTLLASAEHVALASEDGTMKAHGGCP
jgi:hypothetical protein